MRDVLTKGMGTKSIIIVHCRNPGNKPKVRRVLCPAACLGSVKLNGTYTLLASNQFSNNASNLSVNRTSPRTTDNNAVNLIGANSVVAVSVPGHSVALSISRLRLRRHERGRSLLN